MTGLLVKNISSAKPLPHRTRSFEILSSTKLLVSDRISSSSDKSHSTNTPTSQDTARRKLPQSSMDTETEFWLASKVLTPSLGVTAPSRRGTFFECISAKSDPYSRTVGFPVILGVPQYSIDSDSYSVLSHDTTPPSPPEHLLRFTLDNEEFFTNVFTLMDKSFKEWEMKMGPSPFESLQFHKYEQKFLNLPEVTKKNIIMGKRPGGKGFWRGDVELRGQAQELVKIKTSGKKVLLAIEFAWIAGFDCRGGATFVMGNDRKFYYTDSDGDVEDEDGYATYFVHGPYEITCFGSDKVLDPFVPQKFPDGSENLFLPPNQIGHPENLSA
jgi:hypothetical protein